MIDLEEDLKRTTRGDDAGELKVVMSKSGLDDLGFHFLEDRDKTFIRITKFSREFLVDGSDELECVPDFCSHWLGGSAEEDDGNTFDRRGCELWVQRLDGLDVRLHAIDDVWI